MKPKGAPRFLARFGPEGDGGYLVPLEIAQSVDHLLSPGVDAEWGFERDFAAATNANVYLCDGSMERPPDLPSSFRFDRKWLGHKDSSASWTLATWIDVAAIPGNESMALQMDIEGHEYRVLSSLDSQDLERFTLIVVEFHMFERIGNLVDYILRVGGSLRKLLKHFDVVHLHPNNCCGAAQIAGIAVPRVLECTLIRKDLSREFGLVDYSETGLDWDCVPSNKPLSISSWMRL